MQEPDGKYPTQWYTPKYHGFEGFWINCHFMTAIRMKEISDFEENSEK